MPPKPLAPTLVLLAIATFVATPALADENIFGFAHGSETLPQGHVDLYQYATLREGKPEGKYHGYDFETEAEYGITDRLQAGLSVEQHHFKNTGVNGANDALDDQNRYAFGSVNATVKYNLKSPFKENDFGLAFRSENGWSPFDEVAGAPQDMVYTNNSLIFQKNFLDDTLVTVFNIGYELAWGKRPAEEYTRESAIDQAAGVSYRFISNWSFGLEETYRAEYPMFQLGVPLNGLEHAVMYVGPTLHYGSQRFWATASWVHQVWASDPTEGGNQTYAEETKNKFRFKIGFNF